MSYTAETEIGETTFTRKSRTGERSL